MHRASRRAMRRGSNPGLQPVLQPRAAVLSRPGSDMQASVPSRKRSFDPRFSRRFVGHSGRWSLKASTEGMGLRTFPRSSQFAHSEFHVRFNSRPRLKRSLSHRCQQVVARHESGSRPQSFYCGICWRRYSFFFICRYSCSSNSCNWRWYCSVESNHDAKR